MAQTIGFKIARPNTTTPTLPIIRSWVTLTTFSVVHKQPACWLANRQEICDELECDQHEHPRKHKNQRIRCTCMYVCMYVCPPQVVMYHYFLLHVKGKWQSKLGDHKGSPWTPTRPATFSIPKVRLLRDRQPHVKIRQCRREGEREGSVSPRAANAIVSCP